MPFERKDPIPPGRYWIDIPTGRQASYNTWALSSPNVKTVSDRRSEKMIFIVFEVGPGPAKRWPVEAGLGFPTIDKTGKVKAPEDVVQRPKVEDFDLSDLFSGTKGTIMLLGILWFVSRK